jgi:arabinogalactan endo-1,4-beta-galactosidase
MQAFAQKIRKCKWNVPIYQNMDVFDTTFDESERVETNTQTRRKQLFVIHDLITKLAACNIRVAIFFWERTILAK